MEAIYSIIYVVRQIFRSNGNLDFLYFVGLFCFLYYIIRNTKEIKEFAKLLLLYVFFSVLVWYKTTHDFSIWNSVEYLLKLSICFALFISVKENYYKINMVRFYKVSMYLFLVLDLLAVLFYSSDLWRHNDINNDYSKTRLQLFFYEPSELSMCICILFIVYLYKVREYCNIKERLLFTGITLINVVLSAGIGGIVSTAASVAFVEIYKNRIFFKTGRIKKYFIFSAFVGIMGLIYIFNSTSPIALRMQKIVSLNDQSLHGRVIMPITVLKELLPDTHFWGIGLGNMDSLYGLDLIYNYGLLQGTEAAIVQFPNSFLHLIGEMGVIGLFIILYHLLYLCINAKKNREILSIGLLVFIYVYQIMGGYYTNPINWVCYGVIAQKTRNSGRYEEINPV